MTILTHYTSPVQWWKICVFIITIFGLLGHGLTLWAIGYATKKKKYQLHGVQWLTTTVFIFNLAFVSIVYCIFVLFYFLHSILVTLNVVDIWMDEDGSSGICEFFVLGWQQLTLIDGWSMALIAFMQAFPYIK